MAAKELVEYVAKSLVDDPDAVKVDVIEEDGAPESGPRFDIGALRSLWNGPYVVNGTYLTV